MEERLKKIEKKDFEDGRLYLNELAWAAGLQIEWPKPFHGKIVIKHKGKIVHDYWDDTFNARDWLELHLLGMIEGGDNSEWLNKMTIIRPEYQDLLLDEIGSVKDIEVGLMAEIGKPVVYAYA